MIKNLKVLIILSSLSLLVVSCGDDDAPTPTLTFPSGYISDSYEAHVAAENTVILELGELTNAANDAEANAQNTTVSEITYPSNLQDVTIASYKSKVSLWAVELVKAANDDDGFQNPGIGSPEDGENGGLLGTRLLDENGLELEQMIQKGSFGSALYNHAVDVINGDLSSSSAIDKLVEIHGASPAFDPEEVTAAASYSKRRSNQTTKTGFFYDIQQSLIIAKAAIEAGSQFESERDQALADYLLAWEKSNFATVIFYCNSAKVQLQNTGNDEDRGNALHAYAEGVAFARGFRGVPNKVITDAEVDSILELLLAPVDGPVESYKFLNDASLLDNFDQIIEIIQDIYGFTDEEVISFYVNDPN